MISQRLTPVPRPEENQNSSTNATETPISELRRKTQRSITTQPEPPVQTEPDPASFFSNRRRTTQSNLPAVVPPEKGSSRPQSSFNTQRRNTPIMPPSTANSLLESCREVRRKVDNQFKNIENELLDYLNPKDTNPQEEMDPLFRSRLLPSTNPPPDGGYKIISKKTSILPKIKSFQEAFNDLRIKEKLILMDLYSLVDEESLFSENFYRLANSPDSILVSSLATLLHERIIKLPKPCDKNDWVVTDFDESELKQRFFLLPVVPLADFPANHSSMQQVPLRYILLANPVMLK